MILFSTFNHLLLLFLFIYLGLFSGVFYNLINKLFNFLGSCFKSKNKENKNKIFKKLINKIFIIKTKNKIKTEGKRKTNILYKVFKETANIITLSTLVFISLLINLNLNFGILRPVYVVLWIIFFFVGKSLFNLLANYLTSFYNKINKRKLKNGRAK